MCSLSQISGHLLWDKMIGHEIVYVMQKQGNMKAF